MQSLGIFGHSRQEKGEHTPRAKEAIYVGFADKTTAAEYYSAKTAGCEVLYLWALLHRLGCGHKKPTPIYKDTTNT